MLEEEDVPVRGMVMIDPELFDELLRDVREGRTRAVDAVIGIILASDHEERDGTAPHSLDLLTNNTPGSSGQLARRWLLSKRLCHTVVRVNSCLCVAHDCCASLETMLMLGHGDGSLSDRSIKAAASRVAMSVAQRPTVRPRMIVRPKR